MLEITIEARWENVLTMVLEKQGLSEEQLTESKRIFYAGAFGMLTCVKMAFALPDSEQKMKDLEAELDAFALLVGTPAEL